MNKAPIQVKVVLLGASGAGKSSIVLRFVADSFTTEVQPTIASFMAKVYQFNDKVIKFNLWDTAGQERYQSLAKMYYRDARAAIIVYDITSQDSFEELKKWYKELADFGPKDIILIIAGNKEDKVEDESVSPIEAMAFAESIGALYKKTSAKTSYGIEQIFRDLAGKLFPESNIPIPARKKTVTVSKSSSELTATKRKCC